MTKTPEQEARETIDKMLDRSGWDVQDRRNVNIIAKKGVAIREFPLKSSQKNTKQVFPKIFLPGTGHFLSVMNQQAMCSQRVKIVIKRIYYV
ncbi:MAG: hypothetical protein MUO43_04305 [Desulfobacterales bacterium]|nr:hypothetical protein [Desulfobacterales bacterium]